MEKLIIYILENQARVISYILAPFIYYGMYLLLFN